MVYQPTECRTLFSEKEFIIRSSGRMRVFKISSRLQLVLFAIMLTLSIWGAYSYQIYSMTDQIISYQEKQLGETRSAYVDLMSDFVTVHENISSVMENVGKSKEKEVEDIEEYLKKAEIIEDKIKKITELKDWVSEEDLDERNALKKALMSRDIALEEKKLLTAKVQQLEEVIRSLQAFEMEILEKVEVLSNKDMDKIKVSISSINGELKRRGKYFNPLANSKKNNRGGVYVPDYPFLGNNDLMIEQITRTFDAVDDNIYYQEVMKKVPLGKPVWSYWVSSPFGKRLDPFNSRSAIHKGVDLASNKGNKIKTMAEGKVVRAFYNGGYGKFIEIDHGNGFKTKYGHLNAIYVKKGQDVKVGQAIGEVGSTGRSTGPHLHYEILYDGVHMNPMVFIKAK